MNKFIKEQEKQEVLVYFGVFLVVFFLLFNLVGVSFDFTVLPHYLESKKNFGEIKVKLDRASELYNINELRTFELVPLFDGVTGKEDPFSREVVVREEVEPEPEEDIDLEPEEEVEVEESTETEEDVLEFPNPEVPEDLTTN